MTKPKAKYTFPAMFYCPDTGDYVICNDLTEVPEGFVDDPAKCTVVVENPKPYAAPEGVVDERETTTTVSKSKGATKENAAPAKGSKKKVVEETKEAAKSSAKPAATLKSLKITRSEAIQLLAEEKVAFNPKASDGEIAGLIEDLLDDGDSN